MLRSLGHLGRSLTRPGGVCHWAQTASLASESKGSTERPNDAWSESLDKHLAADNMLLRFRSPRPRGRTGRAKPDAHGLVTKHPADSRLKVTLPFSTNAALRDGSQNAAGGLRFGLFLEFLDAMAGDVSYLHSDGMSDVRPLTMVYDLMAPPSMDLVPPSNSTPPLTITDLWEDRTAAVDKIRVRPGALSGERDLTFTAAPTWVGRSSMEIQIDVASDVEAEMSALFTFVALDPAGGKAAPMNRLEPSNRAEGAAFDAGEARGATRKERAARNLDRAPPSAEERFWIHELCLQGAAAGVHSGTSARPVGPAHPKAFELGGQPHVALGETTFREAALMFPQERNVHNKIFGGFLMRKAFELGFVAAHVHGGARPVVLSVDDVSFISPVELGSIMSLSASVVYTSGPDADQPTAIVRVDAKSLDPTTLQKQATNILHFTFGYGGQLPHPLPQILPQTYIEAMHMLNGRRVFLGNS